MNQLMVKFRSRFLFYGLLVLGVPMLLALKGGDLAPNFSAKNQDGKVIQLSDFRGKFVLLYFYPKDDTPGCTKEACSFRDQYSKVKQLNAVVLGISRQDATSHQKFKEKHKLPFDLLVDSDGAIAKSFGVGKMFIVGFILGVNKRQSFLIGPDGRVVRFYEDVDPSHHAEQVMQDIEKATPSAAGAHSGTAK